MNDYVCTECGLGADEYDYRGYPRLRQCSMGGNCNFVTIEEYEGYRFNNDQDDYKEDMRLFKGE